MNSQKRFYTVRELMTLLEMSIPTIHRRLKDGTIPHIKIGHAVRIPAAYVDGLLAKADNYSEKKDA